MKGIRFRFLPGFYIFLATAIIIIPVKWVIAWLVAALVHELFHIVCLLLFGFKITHIEFDFGGASIHTERLSGIAMALCALSGPAGSALLLLLTRVAPRVAICAAIQFAYNLLPVYPLDGGRALRGLSEHLLGRCDIKQKILLLENIVLILLVGIAIWLSCVMQGGLLPIICTAVLIHKNKKIPCKDSRMRVQ